MDNDNEFVGARLEEEVFDIAEENIDFAASMVDVAQTVLMDLDFAGDALAVQCWADEYAVQTIRLAIWWNVRVVRA